MDNNGALKPNFNITSFIKEEKPVDEKTLTDDEKVLAQGADTKFWKVLKDHYDISIRTLDSINDNAIASGMTLEEIGRNALVISQVKGVLNKIINAVEDAKEALESGGKK